MWKQGCGTTRLSVCCMCITKKMVDSSSMDTQESLSTEESNLSVPEAQSLLPRLKQALLSSVNQKRKVAENLPHEGKRQDIPSIGRKRRLCIERNSGQRENQRELDHQSTCQPPQRRAFVDQNWNPPQQPFVSFLSFIIFHPYQHWFILLF